MKNLVIILFLPLLITSQTKFEDKIFYEDGLILNYFGDTVFTSVVNESGLIKSIFTYDFGGNNDGSWAINPEIQILGWSKQGLVAYMHSNGSFFSEEDRFLVIQDLISDKILEEKNNMSLIDIDLLLNKYQIINQTTNYYSKIFEYDIDLNTRYNEKDDCIAQEIQYQLKISHPRYGEKIVTNGVFNCINDIGIFGFFKSPYENRVLIILYYLPEVIEWEFYHVKSFGASLNSSTFE